MAPDADAPMAEEFEQVRQRIEHWRHSRRKQGPMPEELWDEAATLARALGVSRVARALRLGYESLQERVRGPGEAIELAASAGFVELSGVQLVVSDARTPAPGNRGSMPDWRHDDVGRQRAAEAPTVPAPGAAGGP